MQIQPICFASQYAKKQLIYILIAKKIILGIIFWDMEMIENWIFIHSIDMPAHLMREKAS